MTLLPYRYQYILILLLFVDTCYSYNAVRNEVALKFSNLQNIGYAPLSGCLLVTTVGGLLACTVSPHTVMARDFDILRGEKIFQSSCSGCHEGGGNLLSRGKSLRRNDLLKFNYLDKDEMSQLISKGQGQMPAYGSFTSPKGNIMPAKLTIDEIEDVSSYVLQQAETDWKSPTAPASSGARNCDEYPGC
mmetsp:Transcript_27539/g.46371  ORF Transcript_27539/g.46371 Transcript_27539/m.46371 type:complete len:189 (+) Transcript_27539:217-783(+)